MYCQKVLADSNTKNYFPCLLLARGTKGNATVHAIQVSYDISNEKTFRREINGLKTASRITGCKDLLLLTDHDRGTHKDGDLEIRIMPVYEWSITLTQPTNE